MTTIMTELKSDHRSHGLSGMSLIQLEGTLVAATLLLESWRTHTATGAHLTTRPSSVPSSRPDIL
jgi:hypothetical protein